MDENEIRLWFIEGEQKVLDMINYHIHKGEDPNKIKSTETEKTVLHYAAEHQYNTVAETLLEQEMNGLAKDISKKTALGLAIRNKSDDTSAVIARNMKPLELRILFGTMWEGDQNEKQVGKEFNLNEELLKNDCDFTETIRVVFDSLQKPSKNGPDQYDVKPLIEDDQGRMPDACDFNYSHQTGFQNIAEKGLKNVVSHPMFRLLINYKWKTWARRNIARNFVLHILSLISLTVTVALAGTASDVKAYDTSSQRARAFFEVVLFCFVIKTILLEIFQVVRHGFKIYFKERLNWLDLASALLLVIVIPVRYINIEAHWYIFALAYLLWVIKVFKYVVLFSSLWGIWYVGLRTMMEAQPIVEYTGSNGYRPVGTVVMLIFISMTIVVLLNILIAQLSDTYQKIQADAEKSVLVNRAWTIARLERNTLCYPPKCQCGLCCLNECLKRILPSCLETCLQEEGQKKCEQFLPNADLKPLQFNETEEIRRSLARIENKQVKTDLKVQTLNSRVRKMLESSQEKSTA